MLSKKYVVINKNRCVACGACTKVCPRGVITIHRGSYAVVNEEYCVGCGLCGKTCPVGCIVVKAREEK